MADIARIPAGQRARNLSLAALALGFVMLVAGGPASAQRDDRSRVLAATVDSAISPVIANHLRDGVSRAEREGYDAFVVRLDTPGGLDTSMRKIVQRFLEADVPVIVYVSPQGARAASAGAIITFSAHVAAMAPGTAIGASTPVDLEGGDVGRKVINDAAALAESIARLRGRNVDFAIDTVREGRSAAADEAVEIGAVDLLARSLPDLFDEVDGRTVELPAGRTVSLDTAGASVDEYDMGVLRRIQQVLADPNLAFLFLSVGTLGLIYELATPGVGVGGVIGVVLILLAMFALSVLPVNAVGLLLLAMAAALFVAELFAPGIGVAAAGGAALLALSGVFLFRDTPGLSVSLAVIAPVAVVMGGAVVVAGRLVMRSRRSPTTATGPGLFLDRTVTVRGAAGRRGQTFVEGAWWNVRSTAGDLDEGGAVRVVGMDGLDLLVEPVPAAPSGPAPTDKESETT
jgi:membrane-bound serine protease (ClpP class)